MKRLGIMGGTFDPPHWAHMVAAETARIKFSLDVVLFIPAGEPPHKAENGITGAEDRYAMTILATADNPHFEVSRMEIDRVGPSYSVDTIREIRRIYGPGVEIYFITGADEALDLVNWHDAEDLPKLARFLAAPRPGFCLPELHARLPKHFFEKIDLLPMTPIDLSSSEIRSRVECGESIKYFVSDSVETYIRKRKLYQKDNSI